MIEFNKNKIVLMHRSVNAPYKIDTSIADEAKLDEIIDKANEKTLKEEKAAILGYHIITDAPFKESNIITGMYIMLTFLEVNGIKMNLTNEDVINIGQSIFIGETNYKKLLNKIYDIEFR